MERLTGSKMPIRGKESASGAESSKNAGGGSAGASDDASKIGAGKGRTRIPRGDGKPRLCLMGQRRSGKSSIRDVVFHKLAPAETLYLETTTRISRETIDSFMEFSVWDLPAQLDFFTEEFDKENVFGDVGAVIWVLDAQDDYWDAIDNLIQTILKLQDYPRINIEVFLHKMDGLSAEYKADLNRDIQQHITDELADAGCENPRLSFYQTSIYDHTIFEALSKVMQKLVPQLPAIENLLNSLCRASNITKAYLFDASSKTYIAADTSPCDIKTYETCSEYIDMIIDFSSLYTWDGGVRKRTNYDPTFRAEATMTFEKDGYGHMHLKEMNRYLVLVCLMSDDTLENKVYVDYNIERFREGLEEVFAVSRQIRAEPRGAGKAAAAAAASADATAAAETSTAGSIPTAQSFSATKGESGKTVTGEPGAR